MTQSTKYIKIVEWSEEDQCFIGCCPGVIGPCCHGYDEVEVYRELCQIVDEWLAIAYQEKVLKSSIKKEFLTTANYGSTTN